MGRRGQGRQRQRRRDQNSIAHSESPSRIYIPGKRDRRNGVDCLVVSISEIQNDKVAAFYSPQTRFWELLIGSILAYITLYKQNTFITFTQQFNTIKSTLGIVLIATGLLVVTKEKFFPGWWALLPTLGALLIISAGTQAWFNRIILSNRILVWFGLISFPLYLWHWPLLSFAHILEGEASRKIRLAAIFVSIILAWLTYKFIEKPVRLQAKSNKIIYVLFTLMVLTGSTGYAIYFNNGFQGYGPRSKESGDFADYFENSLPKWNYFKTTGMSQKFRQDCDFYDLDKHRTGIITKIPLSQINTTCYTPSQDPKKKNILFIWGDSHAQQLYFGLNNNLPDDWQILIVASSGCPANLDNKDSIENYCQKSNQFAIKTIQEVKPTVVIVARDHDHKADELTKLNSFLLKNGVNKVVFTGASPHWTNDLPKVILRKLWVNTPERTFVGIDDKIINENSMIKAQLLQTKNVVFVDLIGFFCDETGCLTRIGDDKKTGITSWDKGHLTPIASDYLAKHLLATKVFSSN